MSSEPGLVPPVDLGSTKAVELGLEITTGQLSHLVSELEKVLRAAEMESSNETPGCALLERGMRSRAVKWSLFQKMNTVELLEDGYKGLRRFEIENWSRLRKIIVLAGLTGVKQNYIFTDRRIGEEARSLKMAKHRGSVFGGLEGIEQPTVEQFSRMKLHMPAASAGF